MHIIRFVSPLNRNCGISSHIKPRSIKCRGLSNVDTCNFHSTGKVPVSRRISISTGRGQSNLYMLTMNNTLYERFNSIMIQKFHFSTTNSNDGDGNVTNIPVFLLLRYITHSTRSIGVWEGIELLYSVPLKKQQTTSVDIPTKVGSIVWESIRQLPEIDVVIKYLQQQQHSDVSATKVQDNNNTIQIAMTALERAIQIFGSYKSGGIEQIGCFALLAEFQNRNGQYIDCLGTLNELLQTYNSNSNKAGDDILLSDIVQIARAKTYWYQGHHGEAKEICDQLVDQERPVEAIARTGQAMTRLLLISSLDDVFSIRDPFRMSIKRLERMVHPSSTVLAASYLNMGIAEMVWAETVSKFNNVDAPLDAAMRNWKQGITILTKDGSSQRVSLSMSNRVSKKESSTHLRAIIHARLLGNMAHGMLQMTHEHDYVARALEYASESLSVYDAISSTSTGSAHPTTGSTETVENTEPLILIDKEGLGRTLSLLGTCYHLAGNAINAQGLFQSALDKLPMNLSTNTSPTTIAATPLQWIEQRDTYERYIKLCQDWDQREGDAKLMQQKADDINSNMLPMGWKDKSSIHGSLWFWTYATMQRQ
jgi:tetratricopeptide (TPR) repeat protein